MGHGLLAAARHLVLPDAGQIALALFGWDLMARGREGFHLRLSERPALLAIPKPQIAVEDDTVRRMGFLPPTSNNSSANIWSLVASVACWGAPPGIRTTGTGRGRTGCRTSMGCGGSSSCGPRTTGTGRTVQARWSAP